MFRFSIRDLLWLMVVVALACGWWLEMRNRGPENAKLRDEIGKLEHRAEQKKREFEYRLHDRNEQVIHYVKELEKLIPHPLPKIEPPPAPLAPRLPLPTITTQDQLDPSYPIYYPPPSR